MWKSGILLTFSSTSEDTQTKAIDDLDSQDLALVPLSKTPTNINLVSFSVYSDGSEL